MKTIPKEDMLGQIIERADQKYHEQFVRETHEYLRRQREAKERRDVRTSTADKPLQAAEAPT